MSVSQYFVKFDSFHPYPTPGPVTPLEGNFHNPVGNKKGGKNSADRRCGNVETCRSAPEVSLFGR